VGSYLRPIAVVFTNPQLRRLQLAWAASTLGSCAYLIALAVVAFRSGGATAVGFIMLARMVAAALASPPLAAFADRFPRRGVMAISDLARAVLTAAIAVLVEAQAPIITVYALTVVIAVAGTPFRPAQAALTPTLAATPGELTASNAVAGTIESASIFLGPGIGGIVLAVSGTPGVFVVCVIAFLWSAWLVWALDEPRLRRAGSPRGTRVRSASWAASTRSCRRRHCSQSPSRTPPRRWSPAH
jgi:MFS family permease